MRKKNYVFLTQKSVFHFCSNSIKINPSLLFYFLCICKWQNVKINFNALLFYYKINCFEVLYFNQYELNLSNKSSLVTLVSVIQYHIYFNCPWFYTFEHVDLQFYKLTFNQGKTKQTPLIPTLFSYRSPSWLLNALLFEFIH